MPAFALSKPYMDVGVFTNRGVEMRDFYSHVIGLSLTDTLEIEEGYRLYRYDARGSALKINDLDEPMGPARTAFRGIIFPMTDLSTSRELEDPDGTLVRLVPNGELDITQLGIVWGVVSLARAEAFAEQALGAERVAAGRYRVGKTTLLFEQDAAAGRSGAMEAVGFTYTTLHVIDVLGTHARLIAAGCEEAIPPTPFGDVTTYSFIRDPFGCWIEVSQRADLAGSLACVEGPVLGPEEIRAIRQTP